MKAAARRASKLVSDGGVDYRWHDPRLRVGPDIMIELFQVPWSPFCRVQQRLLQFAGARFRAVNVPYGDRARVWKLTRQRYYQVPVLRDGRSVIFETSEDSQVIAKYLDLKFQTGLFPPELEGVQSILWRHIEHEIEGLCFKLNDIHWREFVPRSEQLDFLRFKERRFGRGCLEQWRARAPELQAQLEAALLPFEEMVTYQPFLLGDRPRFVDFDLLGMLDNLSFSGHYGLPAAHRQLARWQQRLSAARAADFPREELHSRHQRPAPRSQLAAAVSGQSRPDPHRGHRGN